MVNLCKVLCFCFVSMLLLNACSKPEESEAKVVNIAFFPNITHSQALVGKANGTFQDALGKDIEIVWREFNAGPAELEALFAGAVDIGYIGPVPAINGFVRSNGDLKIIAGATDGGAILVSRQDLIIDSVQELDGKKIAVPQFGNTQHLSLLNLLREYDLKTVDKGGTVEVVQTDNPNIKTLLDNGAIDAALVPEPWGARLVNEIQANIVLDQNQIWRNGDYPTTVVVVRSEFLEQNPEVVRNFLKAHMDLTDYINANPEASKEIINEQIYMLTKNRLTPEVLNESLARMFISYRPSEEAIFEFIDILQNEGFIKECNNREMLFDLNILDGLEGKNEHTD